MDWREARPSGSTLAIHEEEAVAALSRRHSFCSVLLVDPQE